MFRSPSAISIPYGTIKSANDKKAGWLARKFQFHMVRLKASVALLGLYSLKFQFHMVRLKEKRIKVST